MFLTTRARYAVMAIIDMHNSGIEGKTVSIKAMAERQNLSVYYLEQLFSSLKKFGIVNSIKGPGGGYVFSKKPNEILLYDILKAVGENVQITKCSIEEKASCNNLNSFKCNAHGLWNDLENYFQAYLKNTTLEDIAKNNFFYNRNR